MQCSQCITKPQMVEVKPNIWVCPVCDYQQVVRTKQLTLF